MESEAQESLSELQKSLIKKLRMIYDNDNFILGVLCDVWYSEEDQQAVIDFIDAGEDVDEETVTVLALNLRDIREGISIGLFEPEQIEYMRSLGLDLDFDNPTDDDIIRIEEIVADRLMTCGFDLEYEPTEEGKMCESILDRIGEQ